MNNDFYSPVWADNHYKLSDGIDALFRKIGRVFRRLHVEKMGHAFSRLHALQFDAPWCRERRTTRYASFR